MPRQPDFLMSMLASFLRFLISVSTPKNSDVPLPFRKIPRQHPPLATTVHWQISANGFVITKTALAILDS